MSETVFLYALTDCIAVKNSNFGSSGYVVALVSPFELTLHLFGSRIDCKKSCEAKNRGPAQFREGWLRSGRISMSFGQKLYGNELFELTRGAGRSLLNFRNSSWRPADRPEA